MKSKNIQNIINESLFDEVKKTILRENKESDEVYHITCEGEPVETFESKEIAMRHLDIYKKKHPEKEFIIEKKKYNSPSDMIDKLDEMGEKLELKENKPMGTKKEVKNLAHAIMDAKERGLKEFKINGETHDVNESWKQLEEEEFGDGRDEIDMDKDGKITGKDFKMLRNKKEGKCNECSQKMNENDDDDEDYHNIHTQGTADFDGEDKLREDKIRFRDELRDAENKLRKITPEMLNSLSEEKMMELEEMIKFYHSGLLDDIVSIVYGIRDRRYENDGYYRISIDEDIIDIMDDHGEVIFDAIDDFAKFFGVDDDSDEDYNDEEDMNENKGMCSECGGMMNEGGMCNECGGKMYESKKRTLKLTESELVNMISRMVLESSIKTNKSDDEKLELFYVMDSKDNVKNISKKESDADKFLEKSLKGEGKIKSKTVFKKDYDNEKVTASNIKNYTLNESVPGVEVTKRAQKGSKKENDDYMKEVGKKLKKSASFDGADNPKFPKQNGKGEKMAINATPEQDEYTATHRGGTLADLDYDQEPSENFKKRLKMALEGDPKMGNSQDAANVIKTDTGKNIDKTSKKKKEIEKDAKEVSWGHSWKSPEDVVIVKESKTSMSSVLNEEIERMKKMYKYDEKTQ